MKKVLGFVTTVMISTSASAHTLECEFRNVEIERDLRGRVLDAHLTRGPEQSNTSMLVEIDNSSQALTLGFRNYERKQGWTAKLTFEKFKEKYEASLALSNNRDDKFYTLARTQFDPNVGFQLRARDFFGLTTTPIANDRVVQQLLVISTCSPAPALGTNMIRTASK